MPLSELKDQTLVVATHNEGKAREIADLLQPYIADIQHAGALGLSEPEENGLSFEENALIKAQAAAKESGLVSLADDSGLSVAALDGEPGIYSARWAGERRDFNVAMKKVEDRLKGLDDRSACFICVLALAWPDGRTKTYHGQIDGQIVWPPRGDMGFGYDPIFVPQGHELSFAEMDPASKQSMSHRARAFHKLLEDFQS